MVSDNRCNSLSTANKIHNFTELANTVDEIELIHNEIGDLLLLNGGDY